MLPCSLSKPSSYLSISIIVDRNNKIRHVLGMRALIRKELWSFTTSLTCFENCFSVYDRLTPYLECYKSEIFLNIDTPYAQYRMRGAILRNHLYNVLRHVICVVLCLPRVAVVYVISINLAINLEFHKYL